MPQTIDRVWQQLPWDPAGNSLSEQLTWGKLNCGDPVTKGDGLFPRLEPPKE